MAIYLKEFSTTAAYEAAESGLILPNVSLITENHSVAYKPYVDPCDVHDYVEIGGLKWATKNIGACSDTDIGLYFQWGDTQGYTASQIGRDEGKRVFNWDDYKFSIDGSTDNFSKYSTTDGKTVLDVEDDAAVANWGGNWRMPTTAEFQALGSATISAWTEDYQSTGIKGIICTDKNDSSKVLFFPVTGRASYSNVNEKNQCYYWSSSLWLESTRSNAYNMSAWKNEYSDGSTHISWQTYNNRCNGYAIRPVA